MALTHSDRSYLLSKFCFQERAPTTDKCDGRGLTVASCSTSHSYTVKKQSHATCTLLLFNWISRFVKHTVRATVSSQRHVCVPESPSAWCQCRGFCHPHSSTDRRWTGLDSLTTAVLTVWPGPNGPPHIGFPNSKGKLRSPALTLPHRHSCSRGGLCLRRENGKNMLLFFSLELHLHICNRW